MKQQVLFFFFTLMLTGISVSAQTGGGRIAGVVIDNAGEEPLPGATIFIEELKKGIVTDGHGEFLLSDVPAATYTLIVNLYKEYTSLKSRELEELPRFVVMIWQPFMLLRSASLCLFRITLCMQRYDFVSYKTKVS